MPDDAELLRRYVETRSESAFAALVERHLGLVYGAALRRLGGDPSRATEVAQDVFISLARQAPVLLSRPSLAGWLHTSTRHAALNFLRAEHRRLTRQHTALALAAVNTPDSANDAEWDHLRPLLDAALDQLNETDRTLLLLRFFEQHPFAQIGAQLRLTEDAARIRTARALEKLRAHLARHGITSTAAALGVALAAQPLTAAPSGLAATLTAGALAGTTFTGTALGLTLMTTTTKTLLTATIVGVLTLGPAAFYQMRQLHEAQRALAATQNDLTMQRAQNAALTGRLSATAADLARLNSKPKETTSKIPTAATPTIAAIDREWTIPGYGRATVERERANLGLRYARFYHDLQLTSEQIAKFEKAMIERSQYVADVNTEAAAQGLSPNENTDVIRLKAEAYEKLNQNLRALLGESGLVQYQQYEKDSTARDLAASLAGRIYFSETPLSANQGTEITRVIKSSIQRKMTPMKDEGSKTVYSAREEIDWANVMSQSEAFLLPSQLTVLKQLAEMQRAQTELIRLSQTQKRN